MTRCVNCLVHKHEGEVWIFRPLRELSEIPGSPCQTDKPVLPSSFVYTFLPSTEKAEETGGMCKAETSLGYIVSSGTAWATKGDPVSNKNNFYSAKEQTKLTNR